MRVVCPPPPQAYLLHAVATAARLRGQGRPQSRRTARFAMPYGVEDASLDWASIRSTPPAAPCGGSGDWWRSRRPAETTGRGCHGGSPRPRKLCVGAGEADGVTLEALRAAFELFGSIERVDLPANKTYSFVEFAERAAASRAYVATNNHAMFGKRSLVVSYARSKTGDAPVDVTSPKLWVSGIAKGTRKTDIEKIFGGFGKITRIDAPPGKDYAFIWFDRVEDSEMAQRWLHNKSIGGSIIRVTYSNKPDGAPKGRPKPATVTNNSLGRRDNPQSPRRVAGKPVSPQLPDSKASRPTKDTSPTLAGGDPSWSQLQGGPCTPDGTCSANGGRWSPLSSSSSTSSTSSHPATPLSTPLFIQRHSASASKKGHSATSGMSVEKPPIQLRPSHGLRPFGSRPPAPVVAAQTEESAASRSHQQHLHTKAARSGNATKLQADNRYNASAFTDTTAVVTPSPSTSAKPERRSMPRPEHLRLKLHKSTSPKLEESVVASQNSYAQAQVTQPAKSNAAEDAQKPCSMHGRVERLWAAAPVASGIVTAAFGVWLYYAPAVGHFM